MGDQFRQGKALFGVTRGRGEHFMHGQAAEFFVQGEPSGHAARNRPGQGTGFRHFFDPFFLEKGERDRRRRRAAGVQAEEFPGFAVPDYGEEVAADARSGGLHQAQGGVDRDGGIDGAAAFLEDVYADLRRQGLAGRHHALPGDHFGAGGEHAASQAVTSGQMEE